MIVSLMVFFFKYRGTRCWFLFCFYWFSIFFSIDLFVFWSIIRLILISNLILFGKLNFMLEGFEVENCWNQHLGFCTESVFEFIMEIIWMAVQKFESENLNTIPKLYNFIHTRKTSILCIATIILDQDYNHISVKRDIIKIWT